MRAHVFDMDGTLLHGTTAPLLLAGALGGGDGLAVLEQRFATGTLTAVEFARELHAMWGVVGPEMARHAFGRARVLDNLRDVLEDIRARGERACLITMSPDYFAEQFLDFGFDAVFASRFPRDADTPLDETGILEPRHGPAARLPRRAKADRRLEGSPLALLGFAPWCSPTGSLGSTDAGSIPMFWMARRSSLSMSRRSAG
jgi:phosphoserine phosphatase